VRLVGYLKKKSIRMQDGNRNVKPLTVFIDPTKCEYSYILLQK